jgi:hypothetical protein
MNPTELSYELEMERGPDAGASFPLTAPSHTVGRDPISDLCISDPEVSRQHALLILTPQGGYKIQDLGSTNGTIVDGQRLSGDAYRLQPGQLIALGGSVALRYRLARPETAAPTESEPTGEAFSEENEVSAQESVEAPAVPLVPMVLPQPGSPPREERDDSWQKQQPVRTTPPDTFATNEDQQTNDPGRRMLSIFLGVLLVLLCFCCGLTTFMYYYGGDLLLRQFGIVP